MSWKSNEKTRGVFSVSRTDGNIIGRPRSLGAPERSAAERKSGINSVAFTMLFHTVVVATILYLLRRLLIKLRVGEEGPQRVGRGGQGEQSKENKKHTNRTNTKHNPNKQKTKQTTGGAGHDTQECKKHKFKNTTQNTQPRPTATNTKKTARDNASSFLKASKFIYIEYLLHIFLLWKSSGKAKGVKKTGRTEAPSGDPEPSGRPNGRARKTQTHK